MPYSDIQSGTLGHSFRFQATKWKQAGGLWRENNNEKICPWPIQGPTCIWKVLRTKLKAFRMNHICPSDKLKAVYTSIKSSTIKYCLLNGIINLSTNPYISTHPTTDRQCSLKGLTIRKAKTFTIPILKTPNHNKTNCNSKLLTLKYSRGPYNMF